MSTEPNGKLEVFLSYKIADKAAATRLAAELDVLGRGRISVFVAEKLSAGEPWPEPIHTKLRTADWLILLYTDPTDDWDWCMYETGYFTACKARLPRHLVCLHPAGCPPPNPLAQRKSVPATKHDVDAFLRDLLEKPPSKGIEPIFPRLFSDPDFQEERDRRIETIVGLVAPGTENVKESYCAVPHLQLTIPRNGTEDAKQGKILADSKVRLDAKAAILVFPTQQQELTWKDFLVLLSQDRDLEAWGNDLARRVGLAARSAADVPGLPPLRPKNSPHAFCALLYQKQELMNGSLRFNVAFAETLPGIRPDSELVSNQVFNALYLTQQFSWRVIDYFRDFSYRASRQEPSQLQLMQDVNATVGLVAREAHMCRVFTGGQVAELFKGSTISPDDVDGAIGVLRDAIQEIKNCSDPSRSNASTRWDAFKACVGRMEEVCRFLLGTLALRLSELNPPGAVPMASAHREDKHAG